MKHRILYIIFLPLIMLGAQAQEHFGIAAIVDNAVITHRDVENRLNLLFLNSGITTNKESQENLRRIARQQIIEETLQFQQIAAVNIPISHTAVGNFISSLEVRNNFPKGEFRRIMRKNNIDYEHFERQQAVRLGWNSYLQRSLELGGGISDSEVKNYMASQVARQDEQEVNLREIFLPFESPLLRERTQNLAQDILRRLDAGADFATLARSFSASRSASDGGESGWVSVNFLVEDIRSNIANLNVGGVSAPISTINGIVIIKLEGRRSLGSQESITEDQVRLRLRSKKLELLHRQSLHRLKSGAFIELR